MSDLTSNFCVTASEVLSQDGLEASLLLLVSDPSRMDDKMKRAMDVIAGHSDGHPRRTAYLERYKKAAGGKAPDVSVSGLKNVM